MAELSSFANRAEGGRLLAPVVAEHLSKVAAGKLADQDRPIVLALPRGGVPVGYEVALAIDADLDVIVARKIGVPWQPELGVGAVTEHGAPIFNLALLHDIGLDEHQLERVVERERAEVRRRLRRYRGDRPPLELAGRPVVIVDDGLATGITARAALAAARAQRPAHLAFGAPVCARQSAAALKADADAVLCVRKPARFHAVGLWYDDFAQLSDAEVERILAKAWSTNTARRGP